MRVFKQNVSYIFCLLPGVAGMIGLIFEHLKLLSIRKHMVSRCLPMIIAYDASKPHKIQLPFRVFEITCASFSILLKQLNDIGFGAEVKGWLLQE